MWTAVKRTMRSGFVGFWRNAFVSLAAIFVMTVTLFVVGSVLFLGQLLDASLAQVKDKVDINVYFVVDARGGVTFSHSSLLLRGLAEVEGKLSIFHEKKHFFHFRNDMKTMSLTLQALEELGDNPLGAALSIRAKETSQYEGIAAFLEEQRAVCNSWRFRAH